MGNLTRDPELKAIPTGAKVANFGIATNRSWKDQNGQKQESVEYHNIVAFGKQAEVIAQYMKKGSSIYIEGRLQTRTWEQDGKKNYRTEVVVDNFQFGPRALGGGDTSSNTGNSFTQKQTQDFNEQEAPAIDSIDYPEEDINPEDIPF